MHCWRERETVQPLWATARWLPGELKMEVPPVAEIIPVLGIYGKEWKARPQGDIGEPVTAVLTTAKGGKQPSVP